MSGLVGIISIKNQCSIFFDHFNKVNHTLGYSEKNLVIYREQEEYIVTEEMPKKKGVCFGAYLSSFNINNDSNSGSYYFNAHYPIISLLDGELYNKVELRDKLKLLSSASDSEIIAKGFFQKGEDFFKDLNGKFTIFIINKKDQEYYLVRDRGGVKNVFYSLSDNIFVFGSNIKSILSTGIVHPEVDLEGLWNVLSFPAPPQPLTTFKNIFALSRGSFIKIKDGRINQEKSYWTIPFLMEDASMSENVGASLIKNALMTSVQRQLEFGDNFGSLISGGVDSPFITALAAKNKPGIKAFTMGLSAERFQKNNENERAKLTTDKYSVNHIVKLFSVGDLFKELNEIVNIYEQPGITLATNYFLAKIAHDNGTKVLLNGLGADELHGGFHYFKFLDIWEKFFFLRKVISSFPKGFSLKLDLLSYMFKANNIDSYYSQGFSILQESEKKRIMPDLARFNSFKTISRIYNSDDKQFKNNVSGLMYFMFANCPNHHLYRFEQFTQHFGVQARYPFLDNDFIDASFALPAHLKVNNGNRKISLKNAARNYVARESLGKKKVGFSLPIQYWINNDLKAFSLDMLTNLKKRSYFNGHAIDQLYKTYHNKAGAKIWKLVMLELWFQKFIDKK